MPPRKIDTRRPPCAFGGTTLVAETAAGARAKVASYRVGRAIMRLARELPSKN
jgi:hypothetical protein